MVRPCAPQQGPPKAVSAGSDLFWEFPEVDTKPPWPTVPRPYASATSQRRSPLSISQALKESCEINAKGFAIIYVDDRDTLNYEASPSIALRTAEIFSAEFCQNFRRILASQEYQAESIQSPSKLTHRSGLAKDRRRHSELSPTDYGYLRRPQRGAQGSRKRLGPKSDLSSYTKRRMTVAPVKSYGPSRPAAVSGDDDDDDDTSDTDEFEGAGTRMVKIRADDEHALVNFYTTRFTQMQQIPCKTVNKAWVKVVQPKKQAHNPYNGGRTAAKVGASGDGELTKPDWWPTEGCRHKEPDHINKAERLTLLLHILRHLYGYTGKDGKRVTVEDLEQSTKECFPPTEQFRQIGEWLRDVYRVRKHEERYLRGEIDGDALLTVALPDKESREPTKKSRARARAKFRKGSGPALLDTASARHSSSSQQQSPTSLASPINHINLKQEPAIDSNYYTFKDEGPPSFYGRNLSLQQVNKAGPNGVSFPSYHMDFQVQTSSEPQTMSQAAYRPIDNGRRTSNLGFLPPASNVFAVPDASMAKPHVHQSQLFAQSPATTEGWLSPSQVQSYQSRISWSHPPSVVTDQQCMSQASSPFTVSNTMSNHSLTASPPAMSQLGSSSSGLPNQGYYAQHVDCSAFNNVVYNHTTRGLRALQDVQTAEGSYLGL